eukprot:TRINITY_DN5557_c0_g1_i2.p1 TRINITY_DN5557_c0_g1~~TRINITY_DN5557_c0_g1_i2.p1  ORF type:complete len:190 (-),score=-26.93 TRINITY_DN5557_c0_g1_i2:674-1243(-)
MYKYRQIIGFLGQVETRSSSFLIFYCCVLILQGYARLLTVFCFRVCQQLQINKQPQFFLFCQHLVRFVTLLDNLSDYHKIDRLYQILIIKLKHVVTVTIYMYCNLKKMLLYNYIQNNILQLYTQKKQDCFEKFLCLGTLHNNLLILLYNFVNCICILIQIPTKIEFYSILQLFRRFLASRILCDSIRYL